jgi:hypothetical protein
MAHISQGTAVVIVPVDVIDTTAEELNGDT